MHACMLLLMTMVVVERWIHPPRGRIYHAVFSPPLVEGRDDLTREPLVQRPDDQRDIIAQRLRTYQETIEPVLRHYEERGRLVRCQQETSKLAYVSLLAWLTGLMLE